ncbi:GNAT family N-acetyltransferase [Oscillatoria amoena NRMC-F 0135]|nr:GNAT family N-acetyltransferase [Oscillatoria amoena NRMC-F 0135]
MKDLGNGYFLSEDKSLLQHTVIHEFLSKHSYWAKNIPMQVVEKSIIGSDCVGVYHEGKQVGFARFITDYATFAYLADVFVLPAHRGKGLSKAMVAHFISNEYASGLRNIMLGTQDAHTLYEQFGFTIVKDSKRYMSIFRMNIYEKG